MGVGPAVVAMTGVAMLAWTWGTWPDVIVDFAQYAGRTIYLENRLDQPNGQGGPTGGVVGGGQGFLMLKIIVDGPTVADNSVNPATLPSYYALPSVSGSPTVTRVARSRRR